MIKGTILKGLGGLYTVLTDGGELIPCSARGLLRLSEQTPLAGDRVEIQPLEDGRGRIELLLPRRNALIRPAVCNIDVLVLILSETNPRSDTFIADRITVTAARNDIDAVIAINKTDISDDNRLFNIYKHAGFPVFKVSAVTGEGVDGLKDALSGKTVVFTGNSGVGKSSLLNTMCPELALPTGEVSVRLGRGRHTTRHTEFFYTSFGCIAADTPGFSSFDLLEDLNDLDACYIDFLPFLGKCRFTGCLHNGVLGCAVEAAVTAGEIEQSRYASYIKQLSENGKTQRM